jgi:hypothetical protein
MMRTSTLSLLAAVLCAVTTFIIVPVAIVLDWPNPGFVIPTVLGLVFFGAWARGMAGGQ